MSIPFHNGQPAHDRKSIRALPVPAQSFVYRARIDRVVDGDTLDLVIDQGMHAQRVDRVRLLGINTPERKGDTRAAGDAAMEFVRSWWMLTLLNSEFPGQWPLIIQTEKDDAFGRYLAHIWSAKSGEYLNKAIIDAGHAVPYKEK